MLIKEIFTLLETASKTRQEARIVNHSSLARNGKPLKAKYLGANGGKLGGNGNSMLFGGARWERYHQTKLANIVFTHELKRRLDAKGSAVKAVCAAPGLASTKLQVSANSSNGFVDTWIMKYAQTAADGAMPLIHCCVGDIAQGGDLWEPTQGFGGHMKGPPGISKAKKNEFKEASCQLLWNESEKACGTWDL